MDLPFRGPRLPALLLIAFALRMIWMALVPVAPVSDSAAYMSFARNIAEHGVYGFNAGEPSAYWAVGPAAIYAGAFRLLGDWSFSILSVNMISSLTIVWLLHLLGTFYFNEIAGRGAALLFAFWPVTIQFTTVLASELHFMALSLAFLAAWERARRKPADWLFLFLAGLLLGAATYVRPIALLVPTALALAALLKEPRTAGRVVAHAVVATVIVFAVVAPWSTRNERVLGERVMMSTNFWPNFWMGNHAGSNGEYTPLPDEIHGLDEIERAAHMKELAMDGLRADPSGFVMRTVRKAVRLHRAETIGVAWNQDALAEHYGRTAITALKALSAAYWFAVLGLALTGIVALAAATSWWEAVLSTPVVLWGYFTAVHAVIVVGDRYHMPAIPMIALLAGYLLSRMIGGRQSDTSQEEPAQ